MIEIRPSVDHSGVCPTVVIICLVAYTYTRDSIVCGGFVIVLNTSLRKTSENAEIKIYMKLENNVCLTIKPPSRKDPNFVVLSFVWRAE